jgi:hypothetical protein
VSSASTASTVLIGTEFFNAAITVESGPITVSVGGGQPGFAQGVLSTTVGPSIRGRVATAHWPVTDAIRSAQVTVLNTAVLSTCPA